jgi:glucose/arabinose dehydrogenase
MVPKVFVHLHAPRMLSREGICSLAVLVMAAGILRPQTPVPGASVTTQVDVPASMRSWPFGISRSLVIPPGFKIAVYARVSGSRFMAVAPNGDLLVSAPGAGRVYIVRPNSTGDPTVSVFASGLRNPHDMVFATIADVAYLYISESNQINRYRYHPGDLVASDREVVITGLPDASSPELGGAYGHQLKNIAVGADNKLYVSIASTSNASTSDATSNPVRCAIYQYNADGTGGRLFARGLRNAEGLAFVPGTSTLWVTGNQRDNIRFPFHADWDGDGSDDYGKLMQSYVDNHPPEVFTRVIDGGNYGWPYANPNPDTSSGLNNMPFDPDYETNRDWTQVPQSAFSPIIKGIQAHSAPLGFSFLQGSAVPDTYRNGAVIALHGSWNRSSATGYKIVYFPWLADSTPGDQIDLIRGWFDDSVQAAWGRPVDIVPDLAGNLLISDDTSGTIYKLSSTGEGQGQTDPSATTSFVTAVDPGPERNDYLGWVGFRFAVGAAPITVTALGRFVLPGNTGTHTIKLTDDSGVDVPGALTSVSTQGATPGSFAFANLPDAVTLPANGRYILATTEDAGDKWYDNKTILTTTGAAVTTSSTFSPDGRNWSANGGRNNTSYGPVSFRYQ